MPTRRKKQRQQSDPFFMVLYSPGGGGKTTLAAHAPDPYFIFDQQEDGIDYLLRSKLVPRPYAMRKLPWDPSSWDEIDSDLETAGNSEAKTVVVESITGLEIIAQQWHCQRNYNGDKALFDKYARGRKEVARDIWPHFLQRLKDIVEGGKNVILTAHSTDKEVQESDGQQYLRQKVYCDQDLWMVTYRTASAVCFLDVDVSRDTSKKGLKKVARDETTRYIYTQRSSWNDCKNWHGWPDVIAIGDDPREMWTTFAKEIGR